MAHICIHSLALPSFGSQLSWLSSNGTQQNPHKHACPPGHSGEPDLDDFSSISSHAVDNAWNTVIYQKWGLLGFGVSGLFSVGRYIVRAPYGGNLIPQLDFAYKVKGRDGQIYDLRKEGIKRYAGNILDLLLPAIYYLEESKGLDEEEKVKLRNRINAMPEEDVELLHEWFSNQHLPKGGYNLEQYLHSLFINNWNQRELIPIKRAKEIKGIRDSMSFFGLKELQIEDSTPVDIVLRDIFFTKQEEATNDLLQEGVISARSHQRAILKQRALQNYRDHGMILESALNLSEICLFNLGRLVALLAGIGPLITNALYCFAQTTPKVRSKKFLKNTDHFVALQKSVSSGLKRLGHGDGFGAFLEVTGLSWLRKQSRDHLEDKTPLHRGLMKAFGTKDPKNLKPKDYLRHAVAKWPVKAACDIAILGLGIYILTILKSLWKRETQEKAKFVLQFNINS